MPMSSPIHAVCKNTFISFVATDSEEPSAGIMQSSPPQRSRSAECLPRERPIAEELQEASQQSIQRLTAVLSVGFSSPSSSPKFTPSSSPKESPRSPCSLSLAKAQLEFAVARSANGQDDTEDSSGFGSLSQLRELQGRLGKALQKPGDRPNASSASLATMFPDDLSECGETRHGLSGMGGLAKNVPRVCSSASVSSMISDSEYGDFGSSAMTKVRSSGSVSTMGRMSKVGSSDSVSTMAFKSRMPKVASIGSVSTMAHSEFNRSFTDYGEEDEALVEFELDIEAGAAAAQKDSTSEAEAVPTSKGSASQEMSHSQVPRVHDMAQMYDSTKSEPPTTMMIRNIPGRYSQNDLMLDLQSLGFAGAYDFLYIPMDKSTAANVGYAFVNFIDHAWAKKCVELFENFRFTRQQKSCCKVASVSVAHLQGLEKNLQHYEKSAVNMSRDKRRRPVVVPNIAKMF